MKTHLEYILDNHFHPLSGERKDKLKEACLGCPLLIVIYCFFGCHEEETGLAAVDVCFDSVQLLLALLSTAKPHLILPDLFRHVSSRYSSLEQKKEGAARCAVFSSLSFLLPLITGGSERLSKELDKLLRSCPLYRDLNNRLKKIRAEEKATGQPFCSLTLHDLELILKIGMEVSGKAEETERTNEPGKAEEAERTNEPGKAEETERTNEPRKAEETERTKMILCEVVDGFISSKNALCCLEATQVLSDISRKHGYLWEEQLNRLTCAANCFSAAAGLQPSCIHVASGGVYIQSNSGPVGDLHGDQFVLVRPTGSDVSEEEEEEEEEKEEIVI